MAVLVFIVALGALAITSIIRGWMFSTIWGWFMVPAFGLPVISIPVAIGISLMIEFFTGKVPQDDSLFPEDKIKKSFKDMGMSLLLSFVILIVAAIVAAFI